MVAQSVNNLPPVKETWVQSLGWEDLLEEGTHSSIAWIIPMDTAAWQAAVHWVTKRALFLESYSSVQFSHTVVADPLRPHEPHHARPPCPSPTPGSTQTHVHRVSDAIQPSHPLSSPSRPAFNLSQHQGLFQGLSPSQQVAKVLEFQLLHQSSQ